MVTIVFEAHGTTFDNEAHRSSGWNDVLLSPLGVKQSEEMGKRYRDDQFDVIFCSDLKRSVDSANISFSGRNFKVVQDKRLRECDYGDMTQQSNDVVDAEKPNRIDKPFPNGESYKQTSGRMKDFLNDLKENYEGKRVMVIGHRATQYGLEYWILGKPLKEIISAPWKWQPGWTYKLD